MKTHLINANALQIPLADQSVHMVVTSPPYFNKRNYEVEGQLGLELTPEDFTNNLVMACREIWRVLRDDGTFWLNIGDTYSNGNRNKDYRTMQTRGGPMPTGIKPKDLLGIPWMVAFALRQVGWYLRSEITWVKLSVMPESVDDRPTETTEKIFMFSKSKRYYYDKYGYQEKSKTDPNSKAAMSFGSLKGKNNTSEKAHAANLGHKWEYNPTRNLRNVWVIPPEPYQGEHYAPFPTEIPRRALRLGTSQHGVCPQCGAPWQRMVQPLIDVNRDKIYNSKHANQENQFSHRRIQTLTVAARTAGLPNDNPVIPTVTVGWSPGCKCGIDRTTPATILDPFVGTGSSLIAARDSNRNGIGCDLKLEYLQKDARKRLGLIALHEWTNGKNGKTSVNDLPLFGGIE